MLQAGAHMGSVESARKLHKSCKTFIEKTSYYSASSRTSRKSHDTLSRGLPRLAFSVYWTCKARRIKVCTNPHKLCSTFKKTPTWTPSTQDLRKSHTTPLQISTWQTSSSSVSVDTEQDSIAGHKPYVSQSREHAAYSVVSSRHIEPTHPIIWTLLSCF